MRDVDAIDRELSRLALISNSIREVGGRPSTDLIDKLLDERLATSECPSLLS
jgi:hypothetical protein